MRIYAPFRRAASIGKSGESPSKLARLADSFAIETRYVLSKYLPRCKSAAYSDMLMDRQTSEESSNCASYSRREIYQPSSEIVELIYLNTLDTK